MKTVNDGIRVVNRPDYHAKGLSNEQIVELDNGENAPLMLEPVTLEEIEHTYLLDAVTVTAPEMLLSAITTKRQRLDNTMKAFIKSLRQSMQGTNITAGVQLTELEDGGTKQTLADPIISKPRKAGLVAVITALIPLSDGQTVSVLFYAPDDDPLKITADDTLIAFRFMLNKRDITHIVSPNNGRDISLKQTTMALANAIERNHTKFVANRGKASEEKKALEEKQATLQSLTDGVADIESQVSSIKAETTESNDEIAKLDKRIEKQKRVVSGLQVELEGIEAEKQPNQKDAAMTAVREKMEDLLAFGGSVVGMSNIEQTEYSYSEDTQRALASRYFEIDAGGSYKLILTHDGQSLEAEVIDSKTNKVAIPQLTWNTEVKELEDVVRILKQYESNQEAGASSSGTVPLSSVKTDSVLNPAIKVAATDKSNPDQIWYSQGEPKTTTVGGIDSPEDIARTTAYRDTINAAKSKGFKLERYKHSKLQGIYILINDNDEVLTKQGFDALGKELPATGNTDEPTEPQAIEQPTYDTGALSTHLGTLKAIAAGDVPTDPAAEQLRDITAFLIQNDLLDEHGAELEAAVDAVSQAIKEQFEEAA